MIWFLKGFTPSRKKKKRFTKQKQPVSALQERDLTILIQISHYLIPQ